MVGIEHQASWVDEEWAGGQVEASVTYWSFNYADDTADTLLLVLANVFGASAGIGRRPRKRALLYFLIWKALLFLAHPAS